MIVHFRAQYYVENGRLIRYFIHILHVFYILVGFINVLFFLGNAHFIIDTNI